MTYELLQQYWWFLISLLVNSTGRKWEFTFTTLVTFGGAFFASFPLFYSTSFGGAYWLWMLILLSFVLQAVSYEFQNKLGNLLGTRTFQWFLVANGIVGPLLLGGAVATFFNGSNFVVEKDNLVSGASPVISHWANASHGLDALLDPWNLVLAFAVLFLARVLGPLYFINNVADEAIRSRSRRHVAANAVPFLVLFVAFLAHTLVKDGYAADPDTGAISMQPMKYLDNLVDMWYVAATLLVGVALVLYGILRSAMVGTYVRGIWPAGIGVVLTVCALLLTAGWNDTAYYPSNADLQSSLTIANSCSSEFTLRTMAYVSIFIPFVLAYIFHAWRSIDKKKIDKKEIAHDEAY